MIVGLKYFNARTVVFPLADRLASLVDRQVIDVVTWAPTSAKRLRRRGYDQAELLARAVAARLGLPCKRLLRREPGGVTQTGRSRIERQNSPPRFRARRLLQAERVLLVDDVLTTGATLRSAAAALRAAGAQSVTTRAAAATPQHRSSPQTRVGAPVG
jgi:predicted amidophosphoribosyltransferase